MPSLTTKLASLRKTKNHTFAVLRRNPELSREISPSNPTGLHRSLIPSITNILRPQPTLHLLISSNPHAKRSPDSSSSPSSSSTSPFPKPATPLTLATDHDGDDNADDNDDADEATAVPPPSPWTCPPSAVPWPPQTCAAPLSTHHRLAPCTHVVRTPFLTPCGANCAHVAITNASPSSSPSAPPLLPPFVVDEAFACAVCIGDAVSEEAERRRTAFLEVVERNATVLTEVEGELETVVAAYERVLALEMEEEKRTRVLAGGRRCEAAAEKDGHAWGCP